MNEYDAILIGTGQATGTLVSGLIELGQKVAVIERDRELGLYTHQDNHRERSGCAHGPASR